MSAPKFTPAPWRWIENEQNELGIIDAARAALAKARGEVAP